MIFRKVSIQRLGIEGGLTVEGEHPCTEPPGLGQALSFSLCSVPSPCPEL